MCEYTDRRNNDSWECPCPYRDRCERASRNNGGNGCNNGIGRQNGCGNNRSDNARTNRCGICNLFRRCCNR